MSRNRSAGVAYSSRIPQAPSPAVAPGGFLYYPLAWLPSVGPAAWAVLSTVYQGALAQALAVCRPSLPERDLLGYWN